MGMNVQKVRNKFIKACYNSAPMGKKSSAAQNMINFYTEGAQNPSVAKAIAGTETNKTFSLPVLAYPQWFYNYNALKKHPDVKPAYEKFEKAFDALYPKTGNLRKFLIEKSRLSFAKVLPKMNSEQKTAAKAYYA